MQQGLPQIVPSNNVKINDPSKTNGVSVKETDVTLVEDVSSVSNHTRQNSQSSESFVTNSSIAMQHGYSSSVERTTDAARYIIRLISPLQGYRSFTTKSPIDEYLQYIWDERLIHMPRKGSGWDRVLRTAEAFGLQIWSLAERLGKNVDDGSFELASAALSSCQVLLHVSSPIDSRVSS